MCILKLMPHTELCCLPVDTVPGLAVSLEQVNHVFNMVAGYGRRTGLYQIYGISVHNACCDLLARIIIKCKIIGLAVVEKVLKDIVA